MRLIPSEGAGVLVRFPDIPEAVATGRTEDEAIDNVRPVLAAVLESYVAEGRRIPEPSDICGAPTLTFEDPAR
jgi:predicted RNase H-like HicB family nuclease